MTTPPADSPEATLIRSEEELQVSTRSVAAGKVRLLKRIVTEDVTVTVPVSREEVFLERVALTDDDRADLEEGVELTEHTWELVLWAEQVQVSKVTVPVERVRLSTQVVTEEQDVTDVVRKEQLAVDRTVRPGTEPQT